MELDSGSSVVAPYPTSYRGHQEEDKEAQEEKARVRSLVPVTLRVQRRPPQLGSTKPTASRQDAIRLQPVPQPAVALVPTLSMSGDGTADASVSKEYERFMEEMKRSGAL